MKNIVNEIELKLERKLFSDKIEFVKQHNKNEYEFVKIIQHFFDQENKTKIFFAKDGESKYEKCLEFTKFVLAICPELTNIIIVSDNLFTFYDKYAWEKALKGSSFALSIIPIGQKISLINKKIQKVF